MPEKHAAGYVRVSSEEQAAHGISVDAQRAILEGWAAMTQAGPLEIYQDPGFSGKNTQRPALQRLLADVRAGAVSVVVVWKLDRLSRSLRDTLAIIEDVFQPRGVSLVSTTESIDTATPAGRMMLNMLASFAQLEREQDSDRVLMAHKHLAEDCRYLGGHIPLGYRVDDSRHYQLDPVTAPVVRRAFEMYLSRAGYGEILEHLNAQAPAFYRRKSPWKKSDLNYLLGNEVYAGTYVHRLGMDKRTKATRPEVVRIPGGVPAILSPEEWQRVCDLREENRTRAAAYRAGVWPLSGLVRCAVCGSRMVMENAGRDRNGTVARYYTCRRRCVKPARLEQLEAAVLAAAAGMADNEDALRRACAIANDYDAGRDDDRAADAVPVEGDLIRVRQRMARITAYIGENGAEAPRALMDELRRLEREAAGLESRLEALRRPACRYDPEATLGALRALAAIRGGGDGENKKSSREALRALFREALHAVTVADGEVGVVVGWHAGGGDDPPLYVCHKIGRKKNGGISPPPRVVLDVVRPGVCQPITRSTGESSR